MLGPYYVVCTHQIHTFSIKLLPKRGFEGQQEILTVE